MDLRMVAIGAAACEASGIDRGADSGFVLGGPHRAVALGDFPLDHGLNRAGFPGGSNS